MTIASIVTRVCDTVTKDGATPYKICHNAITGGSFGMKMYASILRKAVFEKSFTFEVRNKEKTLRILWKFQEKASNVKR